MKQWSRMHIVYDRANKPLVPVSFNEKGQPDGDNASEFSNFIATLVKTHIPLGHEDWRLVDVGKKNELLTTLKICCSCWRLFHCILILSYVVVSWFQYMHCRNIMVPVHKEADLQKRKDDVQKKKDQDLQKKRETELQKKKEATDTQKNHQKGKEVILYNIYRDHSTPVAKATILSTDRNKIVGGLALGTECCEVVVDYIIKRNAILPRPIGNVTTMGQAQGRTIAWLYKHLEVDTSKAKQTSLQQEE